MLDSHTMDSFFKSVSSQLSFKTGETTFSLLISSTHLNCMYENWPLHWAPGSGLHGPGNWPACELAEQSFLAPSYSVGNSASSPHWPPWISQWTAPVNRQHGQKAHSHVKTCFNSIITSWPFLILWCLKMYRSDCHDCCRATHCT